MSGAASMAYGLGSAGKSGASGVASGLRAAGEAAASAATSPLRRASQAMRQEFRSGARSVLGAATDTETQSASTPPAWASAMKQRQSMSHGVSLAAHSLRSGDGGGAGSSVDLQPKD